jgi:2-polyprenyl-3-methyl-5-hydroxy-6-metoxy-1,4-benzoquinol methylase
MSCVQNHQCLACGQSNLQPILDLKDQPLANDYQLIPINGKTYPLLVNLCRTCFHLQLSHSVAQEIIYKNYLYKSGTNQTIKEYCDWFAGYVTSFVEHTNKSILDIGCNDGVQLDSFKKLGWNTFGIDPAENLYSASSVNHEVSCGFFNSDYVSETQQQFDIIVAQNVMAHNPNPFEFLNNCKNLMNDTSLLFIQTSQANMILNNEFDTIYHEHVNFFNVRSMKQLADRVGINLIDVIKSPIHGISYIFVFSKTISKNYNIENIINTESQLGLYSIDTYKKWRTNIIQNTKVLKNMLVHYKENHYQLIGYGAAAKGNTLLNYMDIKLDLIVDDNPLKHNLFTPGTNIIIKDSIVLKDIPYDQPVLFIPLAWNFFEEIREKILLIRHNKNDMFVKYFPTVEVFNV